MEPDRAAREDSPQGQRVRFLVVRYGDSLRATAIDSQRNSSSLKRMRLCCMEGLTRQAPKKRLQGGECRKLPLDRRRECATLLGSVSRETLAEQLKAWREVRGLSQRDLAERSGVFYTIIARLELGKTDSRLSTLERLAEAMEIGVVDLLTGPEKPKRPSRKRARGK